MSKVQSAVILLSLSIGLSLAVDICEYQMNGVHLSHPADCNQFVECQNGKTNRILSCPLGLHFNRFKSVCDLRQRAGCDIQFVNVASEETNCSACCALYGCYAYAYCPTAPATPTSPSTYLTTDTDTTEEYTSVSAETHNTTTDTAGTLSPFTTPITDISTTVDSTDTPVTSSKPDTAVTDNPTTVDSTDTPVTLSTFTTPASPETPVTPDIPKTNQCANNLTVCQEESDNSVMHVNGTCNQYIVCVAGCAYIRSCPANLQFDIAKQICDHPQNVNCPWQSTTAITGPSGVTCAHHGQCEKQLDGKMFASPNSDGYIICQCECEIERPCPEGTKFDMKLLTCAWKANRPEIENGNNKNQESDGKTGNNKTEQGTEEENTSDNETADGSVNIGKDICRNDIEICKNQSEGTLFPVDGICNKFYKCNYGCAVEILCPNNLVYNPQTEYCDYPENYICPWLFTAPSGPTAGPSGIACASGGRCLGKLEGTLLPSLTSCAKYVVCQCECEVERDCAQNLYWDRNLLTCNYSANVTCDLNLQ